MAAVAVSCALAVPALAETMDDLNEQYQIAVTNYEYVLNQQERNNQDVEQTEHQIARVEEEFEAAQEMANEAAVALYKSRNGSNDLIDMVMHSESLTDAINRFESYERIEAHYVETLHAAQAKQAELDALRALLEERKAAIKAEVAYAKESVDRAEEAIRNADHTDGADYHQLQGNGANCGATSFIVGVNILLHENKFTDNVKVWEEPGFNEDSTTGIAQKGRVWLADNDLDDVMTIEDVKGDIHTTDELREELEQGRVVVISSGSGSTWMRADGSAAEEGSFPNGHFIVFYHYEDGVFYANDSSVKAELGAGCAYDEEQMDEWLKGRDNHFASVMYML